MFPEIRLPFEDALDQDIKRLSQESEAKRLLLPILQKHKNEDICFTTAIDEVKQNFEDLIFFEDVLDSKEEVIGRMREIIKELECDGRLDREKEALRFERYAQIAEEAKENHVENESETRLSYFLGNIVPI